MPEVSQVTAAPTIYLAHTCGGGTLNFLQGKNGVLKPSAEHMPAVLVSFAYIKPWNRMRPGAAIREWCLDSGAFTARSLGIEISNEQYIETALRLVREDSLLTEVFALDVIGDARASLRNTEEARRAGLNAIPTFHYGTGWEVLAELCKRFDKVAIGGMVGIARKPKHNSGRLQMQERMVTDIGRQMVTSTGTDDVAVFASGQHLCTVMRGVKTPNTMSSSYVVGRFRDNAALRAELFHVLEQARERK